MPPVSAAAQQNHIHASSTHCKHSRALSNTHASCTFCSTAEPQTCLLYLLQAHQSYIYASCTYCKHRRATHMPHLPTQQSLVTRMPPVPSANTAEPHRCLMYLLQVQQSFCTYCKCSRVKHNLWNAFVCLIWFFTSQSTVFQLCREGSSWVELVLLKSCSRTQCSDAGEAGTGNPSILSQALYHWAP